MLGFINSKLSMFSMVTGLVLLIVLVNKGYLNPNDIHIMYWLLGIIFGVYVISWLFFIVVIGFIIKSVFKLFS